MEVEGLRGWSNKFAKLITVCLLSLLGSTEFLVVVSEFTLAVLLVRQTNQGPNSRQTSEYALD